VEVERHALASDMFWPGIGTSHDEGETMKKTKIPIEIDPDLLQRRSMLRAVRQRVAVDDVLDPT